MNNNKIEELQERLEELHRTQDARLACNADDLDIREEIAEAEDEIKELQDDINEKNNNGNDTNVGSIENSIKKCPCCGSEKLTYFKESVLTRYYKLDKNNNPTKRCIRKSEDSCNMPENWKCEKCGEIFGGTALRKEYM